MSLDFEILSPNSICKTFSVVVLQWVFFFYNRHLGGYFLIYWMAVDNSNPLQYSWLENPVDRGSWRAAVHRIAQSRTRLKWLSMHACIGEGNGTPLQYSCLENPRDRGAWWAAVFGVAKSRTQLKWLSSSSSWQC